MSWNNGLERKKFEKRQAFLAEQYRSVGMTEQQIQQMYEFDLAVFRSERIYYTHTQALEICSDDSNETVCDVSNFLLKCQTEVFRNYSNRYWWIDELEKFYYKVMSLTEEEKELITLYVFDGYTQKEIANIRNCAQNTISYQLTKIKDKLLSVQGGGKK